jgi:hypothetical protein
MIQSDLYSVELDSTILVRLQAKSNTWWPAILTDFYPANSVAAYKRPGDQYLVDVMGSNKVTKKGRKDVMFLHDEGLATCDVSTRSNTLPHLRDITARNKLTGTARRDHYHCSHPEEAPRTSFRSGRPRGHPTYRTLGPDPAARTIRGPPPSDAAHPPPPALPGNLERDLCSGAMAYRPVSQEPIAEEIAVPARLVWGYLGDGGCG